MNNDCLNGGLLQLNHLKKNPVQLVHLSLINCRYNNCNNLSIFSGIYNVVVLLFVANEKIIHIAIIIIAIHSSIDKHIISDHYS